MGILNGLLGDATEVNREEVAAQVSPMMIEGESIEQAYKLIRDLFVFTQHRLILIDIQGITGKKIDYYSLPYKSISHFSVETAGHFDLDSELKIWLIGNSVPFSKQFKRGSNLEAVQKALAYFVLKFK